MKRAGVSMSLVASVLALAACSSGGTAPAPTVTVTAEAPSSTAMETPVDETTTDANNPRYQDWAKSQGREISQWLDEWDVAGCTPAKIVVGSAGTDCMVEMGLGTVAAKGYFEAVDDGFGEDGNAPLGDPSDAQVDILDDLSEATGDLEGATDDFETKGCLLAPSKNQCGATIKQFVDAMRDLQSALRDLEG